MTPKILTYNKMIRIFSRRIIQQSLFFAVKAMGYLDKLNNIVFPLISVKILR